MADAYWLEQLDEQCREHNREIDELYKRIAELEQLVRELRKGAIPGDMDACEQCTRDCFTDCPIYLRMKELGIEVNE